MFERTKHLMRRGVALASKSKALLVGAVVGVATVTASAGEPTFTPVDLDAITFPINLSSIAIAVATAGGTMIGLWAIYKIGFKLVRKFTDRMGSVV